ncbi:MAG TPA: hypothetical protein VF444_22720 [Pseudonocardiaceae bacterium]
MSQPKSALVLHLTSGSEPLLIAIDDDETDKIAASIPDLIRRGQFETITAANGTAVTVNFSHVIVGLVDHIQGLGQPVYGMPERTYGG